MELIVVLVVISITAGLALPAYSSAVTRYRLQSATHQLSTDIDRATRHARATMRPVTVIFDGGTHRVRFASLPSRRSAGTDHVLDLLEHPNGAQISSADFSGQPWYTISAFGVPSSGGMVVLRGADSFATLTIDASTGAVSTTP